MRTNRPTRRLSIGSGKTRRRISRRRFLAETTLAGAALTLPAWLIGCGEDTVAAPANATPTPTPGARPRERRTLNFDFSFGNLRDVRLIAVNSPSYGRHRRTHGGVARQRPPGQPRPRRCAGREPDALHRGRGSAGRRSAAPHGHRRRCRQRRAAPRGAVHPRAGRLRGR